MVFCDVTFAGKWGGYFLPPPPPPRHISGSRAHNNKILMAIQYFRGQAFQWCHFRYRVSSTSARNPRWRSPKGNVQILRLFGLRKIISNTQWAILSVRVLNEKQTTTYGTCRRQVTKMVTRSRPKPEVVLTSAGNINRMFPWSMTSRNPEKSISWPQYA